MLKTIEGRSGRYIDPNAPLDRQVEQLKAFLDNPPQDSRRLKFSPDLAHWIISNMNFGAGSSNRPFRSHDVARYAKDMEDGNWTLTGDTIKFSRHKWLIDGQHRLRACVRAGVPFETFVVFGIHEDAFSVTDIGRKRINTDIFAIAGVKYFKVAAPATRWVRILTSDDPKDRAISYEGRELLDFYYKGLQQPLFDECVKAAYEACSGSGRNKRGLVSPALAAVLYLAALQDEAAAFRFCGEVAQVKGNGGMLVKALNEVASANMGRVHDTHRNALTIIAVNKALKGERLLRPALEWNLTQPFPKIGG